MFSLFLSLSLGSLTELTKVEFFQPLFVETLPCFHFSVFVLYSCHNDPFFVLYVLWFIFICKHVFVVISFVIHSEQCFWFTFIYLFTFAHRHFIEIVCTSLSQVSCSNNSTVTASSGSESLLSPVGSVSRPLSLTNSSLCSESTTSSVSSLTSNYAKAPGFEREDQVHRLHSLDLGRRKLCRVFHFGFLFVSGHHFLFPGRFNLNHLSIHFKSFRSNYVFHNNV